MAGKLTALKVRNANVGRHGDGDGLYLVVKPSGGRSWVLRVQADGRRRDVGLGSVDLNPRAGGDPIDIPLLHRKRLSLAEARDKSAILRKAAAAGLDPIVERDRDRRGVPNFQQAAERYHAQVRDTWAPRQQAAFLTSLQQHAYGLIGALRVDQITVADIQSVLSPIWTTKPDMARKVRQRIAMVLDYAHAQGWRKTDAPRKSVTSGLPKRLKGGNYAAMPYAEIPAFVATLRNQAESLGRLALLFTILTAARSGEVRHARWSHIDLDQRLWIRPAELMKMRIEHTVTLSIEAVEVLTRVKPLSTSHDGFCFPSHKQTPLSDMTLSKVLRSAKLPFTVHGFRSSFRDWAAETMTSMPDAVAEAALAHTVPDAVIKAYKRTTFIELRHQLLGAWARYLIPGRDD